MKYAKLLLMIIFFTAFGTYSLYSRAAETREPQALCVPFSVFGKVTNGTSVIDGAIVTLKNDASQAELQTVTSQGGFYSFETANLSPCLAQGDSVTITATKAGFSSNASFVHAGGALLELNVTLPPDTPIDPIPQTTPSGIATVFRFWSGEKQGHFFTISATEKDRVASGDQSWAFEGAAFKAFSTQETGTLPVHRFWSDQKQHHFFTISETEKNQLIANDPSWAYEGVSYFAYPTEQTGSVPLYRFWSDQKQGHFFTISGAEKANIIATDPSWTFEGIAYHVPTN